MTATIQPGLHHTAMKWLFLASESLLFGLFYFFPHTHHTTYSGIHWLLVTTQENERKVRKSLRKRRKTCVTIIVRNRTRNLSIGNRCTYHCTIRDTHTHTHTHTHTYTHAHTHTHTCAHTHTPLALDYLPPIARGDDSNATAEAIAAWAEIAPFNSLES